VRRTRSIAHQLFSTKQFVPGHLVGAAIIAFGTVGLVKIFTDLHDRELGPDRPRSQVRAETERGQYGKRP